MKTRFGRVPRRFRKIDTLGALTVAHIVLASLDETDVAAKPAPGFMPSVRGWWKGQFEIAPAAGSSEIDLTLAFALPEARDRAAKPVMNRCFH